MLTKIKIIISLFKRGQLEQKYRESLQRKWYSILSQPCKLAEFQKVAASFNLSCCEALIWTGLYTWGKKLLCRLFVLHGNFFFVVSSKALFSCFNNITVCRDRLKLLHWYPANVLTLCSVSVRRALKVAMTPSTWLQSPWWLPTAPSGIQPNQSQKNSWSRCSPASSSSAKSRKPLTCRRACTSGTGGEQWTD